MKRKLISRQKAIAICRREGIPYRQIATDGPYLLRSGAKLGYSTSDSSYVIAGYAQDGSDVDCYFKK